MKLIFDSGSSKCTIVQQDGKNKYLQHFTIQGFNPIIHADISKSTYEHFKEPLLKRSIGKIESILFCGAGCINDDINTQVKHGLHQILPYADINICTDLDFIGQTLQIQDQSIIAILGTGSNAGLWNGQSIIKQNSSGGYLLGDEGSGFDLGKKLIINYLRNSFSPESIKILNSHINLTASSLIQKLYSSPTPNKDIASYATLFSKINDPLKDQIITQSFTDFFDQRVRMLKEETSTIHLFGSVAYFNIGYIKPLLEKLNLRLGVLSRGPLDQIIN